MKSLIVIYSRLKGKGWYLFFALLIAFAAALVAPNGKRQQYQYQLNKPWGGELLTAPYDFPIYKDAKDLEHEQDSVRRAQLLVMQKDEETLNLVLSEVNDNSIKASGEPMQSVVRNYLLAKLREVYSKGIIDVQAYDDVLNRGDKEVWVLQDNNNERRRQALSEFFTLSDAYKYIIESRPREHRFDDLAEMNISQYLKANVYYSEDYTNKLWEEELRKISGSTGIVGRGVRIVDKGEVVTPEIFNQIRSLERVQLEKNSGGISSWWFQLGLFVVLAIWFIILLLYLSIFTPEFLSKDRNVMLLGVQVLLFVLLSALNAKFDLFNPYIIPFVMVVMIMHVFFDTHVALISYLSIVLASAIFMPDPIMFIMIQMGAGLLALFSMTSLNSRAELLKVVFHVLLYYAVMVVAIELFVRGGLNEGSAMLFLYLGINAVFLMFTYILTFIIEKVLGYTSYLALIELADVNSPLLRQLNEQASGTFQHSYNVSALASDATDRIGGNANLVRVAALYHDIGKIINPAYFTENQAGRNLHENLSYEESAQIIIKHVSDGILIAQKNNLPNEIIDFIRTHHGTGLTKYFYNSYCNEHPDEVVDPARFRYAGPNPSTREQGVLMLADAVEASSRSLKVYTEQSLNSLINKIVDDIVAEGLLDDTPLTLRDLSQIKEVFLGKLKTFYHSRIAYPEKK